ncbi:hypothetical protein Celaphus_00018380 [Cervus elaphus hippelaphus]|uniref:P/Homo B domain-containing protein n=1 Tax=Cervus elaphus hippelaphus TaxID=46360 RepID=A0A212C5L8_CEREH|nr:hypothetical protein Celaphus_00018380 [Cervus elaphus hippelaphus]
MMVFKSCRNSSVFVAKHPCPPCQITSLLRRVKREFGCLDQVEWIQQQVVKKRTKRDYDFSRTQSTYFNDPKWPSMWYMGGLLSCPASSAQALLLHIHELYTSTRKQRYHCSDNTHPCQSDMNIEGAWKRGYTGKNIVVTILDDGIERTHPDLMQNYDALASYDVNGNDLDPMPRYDASNENKGNRFYPVWNVYILKVETVGVITTDLRQRCTDNHTGTSASAPMAAGIIALALEAKHGTRCAGEVAAAANNSHCTVGIAFNAKIGVSHLYGFGLMDAEAMVMEAEKWTTVPQQHVCVESTDRQIKTIRPNSAVRSIYKASGCSDNPNHHVNYLEHEGVSSVLLSPSPWKSLRSRFSCKVAEHDGPCGPSGAPQGLPILAAGHLLEPLWRTAVPGSRVCPGICRCWALEGTRQPSQLVQLELRAPSAQQASPSTTLSRLFDHSMEGFKNWEFMTIHCWGERAAGDWILEVYDTPSQLRNFKTPGKLKEWSLVLYGTSVQPYSPTNEFPKVERVRYSRVEDPTDDYGAEDYAGPCDPECSEVGCDGPGPDHCNDCLHYYYKLKNNTRICVSSCPPGHYHADKKRCRKCAPNCESCFGSHGDQCLSCKYGYFLNEETNSCVTHCPDGSYQDTIWNMTCNLTEKREQECGADLRDQKLTSEQEAQSSVQFSQPPLLAEGHVPWGQDGTQGSRCAISCEDGWYFNGQDCQPCHRFCATCAGAGADGCINCTGGYFMEERRCVQSCSISYYLDHSSENGYKSCKKCDASCLTCNGPGIKNCTSCPSGYLLDLGMCQMGAICKDGHGLPHTYLWVYERVGTMVLGTKRHIMPRPASQSFAFEVFPS